jgi:hypothetical protein
MPNNLVREHIREALAAAVEAERERVRADERIAGEIRRRETVHDAKCLEMLSPLIEACQQIAAEMAGKGIEVEIPPQRDKVHVKIGVDPSGRTGRAYQLRVEHYNPDYNPDLNVDNEVFKFLVEEFEGTRLTGWKSTNTESFRAGDDALQLIVDKIAAYIVGQEHRR